MGFVYLLHFDKPLYHAQHYLGYADRLEARIGHHKNGTSGVAFVRAMLDNGATFQVVRTWEDVDRNFERRLKNGKNARKWLCPICRGEATHEISTEPEAEPEAGSNGRGPLQRAGGVRSESAARADRASPGRGEESSSDAGVG